MSQAIFKFNNGNSALVCSGCSIILKTGSQFSDNDILAITGKRHMDAQFCIKCNLKRIFNNKSKDVVDGYLHGNVLLEYMPVVDIETAINDKLIGVHPENQTQYKLLI